MDHSNGIGYFDLSHKINCLHFRLAVARLPPHHHEKATTTTAWMQRKIATLVAVHPRSQKASTISGYYYISWIETTVQH